ncbi:MAG: Hsp33 family molecular chaperone HslO [Chthoniobacterales bacterium]
MTLAYGRVFYCRGCFKFKPDKVPLRPHTFYPGPQRIACACRFGELYVEYYLHQGQHGYHHAPEHDGILKETLAALALHCASRPWSEAWAWTLHFKKPLLNLFVTGDNRRGIIVGQVSAENVKDDGRNIFYADVARERAETRRSSIEFEGSDPFRVIEQFYARSEQRPACYFQLGTEDFAMISAQPGCDLEWFARLTHEQVAKLAEDETLSLLEERAYEWGCGCSQERMFPILASILRDDPEGLFGDDDALRINCPRCGARHTVTREAREAFVSGKDLR